MKTDLQEPFKCADRRNLPEYPGMPKQDHWRELPNGDHTCSFCGSMHPKDFERLVVDAANPELATMLDMTTKAYKFYIRQAGVKNASEGAFKFYSWHIADDEFTRARYVKLVNAAIQPSAEKFEKMMEECFPGQNKES